jgi:hypothetical protein
MSRGSAPGERRGGRSKGVKNKTNAQREAAVAASGLTPLDFLLQVMRDEATERGARIDAAKAAAPYVHPKLANVQHSGDQDNPVQHQVGVAWMTESQAKSRGWA